MNELNETPRRGVLIALFKLRWLIVYAATFAAMIWWYEIRPTTTVSRQLQGTWREIEGVIPDERLRDVYRHVDENETWLVYPLRDEWRASRSRVALRPADNFFVVRREFGFDYGNTRETEYIVCVKDDALYILHGLARLDPVKENRIRKLRRVDSLPAEARESIQASLERTSAPPGE